MQALFDVILPVFVVIAAGYGVAALKIASDRTIDETLNFTQRFAIPVMLFLAISDLDIQTNFSFSLLISYYSGALTCFVIATLGAHFIFKRAIEDSIAIGFCALFSNTLMLGLPITERAYGTDALASNFVIISFHSAFCYLVGITAMETVRNRGGTPLEALTKIAKAMFSNALVIGIALGFAVNLSGFTLPYVVREGLSMVGGSAIPIALVALGAVIYRYKPEGQIGPVVMVMILSLFVHPIVTYSLGSELSLSDAQIRSAVITAAVAPGINGYVFANMYNRAKRVAATTILASTLLSIPTVWVWLHILP